MINIGDALLQSHLSTFKETSYDDTNRQYMSDSEVQVVNFDDFKNKYCSLHGWSNSTFRSTDALWIVSSKLYLVEFKNGNIFTSKGKICDLTNEEIRTKINESIIILSDSFNQCVSDFRNDATFILVYNDSKYRSRIHSYVTQRAGVPLIRFGMTRYKGTLFHDVKTLNESEFSSFINTIVAASIQTV